MRSNLVFMLGMLGASAWAAPGSKCKKAVCNADNCLRAVRATSAKPFASSATADCSSFMQKTVTPCAATTTTTVTATVTASPSFQTVTAVVDNTQLFTAVTDVVTVVTTIEDTVTFIQPTEVDVIQVVVTPVTVTAAPVNKRYAEIPPLPPAPTMPAEVLARAVTSSNGTCAATTNAPTSVPTYASACSGTARYSSACACAGVTGGATTLAQSTVIATATSTFHFTPISTVTATSINNIPVTVVKPNYIPTAFETTDATVIIPSAFTVVSTLVVPTTVVVAPPVCSTYKFVATDGPRAGQYIGGQSPNNSPGAVSYGFITFTDAANANTFIVRPDNSVYDGTNTFGWVTRNNNLYYVLQMNDYSLSAYRVNQLKCSINRSASSSVAGAVGQLTCTTDSGNPISLVSCANTGNNLLQSPNPSGTGCQAVTLAAVPAC